jgi:hypothetical protein
LKRIVIAVAIPLFASVASAQLRPDLMRFEAASGLLLQGDLGAADLFVDFSQFGGLALERQDGSITVDPSVSYGLRAVYRLNEKWSVNASWTHSEGRYEITFPALSTEGGEFDLEGLLLAGDDFVTGGEEGTRAGGAMSKAFTDVYRAAVTVEFPILDRWAFPYFTVGGGVLKQKSDGDVIRFDYEGPNPPWVELLESQGISWAEAQGLPIFSIDEFDPIVTFGAGVRVSMSERWGLNASIEDLWRLNVDVSEINEHSSDPIDPSSSQFYSIQLRGEESSIHNVSIQLAIDYAFWPYGKPR